MQVRQVTVEAAADTKYSTIGVHFVVNKELIPNYGGGGLGMKSFENTAMNGIIGPLPIRGRKGLRWSSGLKVRRKHGRLRSQCRIVGGGRLRLKNAGSQ